MAAKGRPPPTAREPAPPSLGWTVRDDVPYARTGHTAIMDDENDRMIVFGGSANDAWQLPLSGPNVNAWTELKVSGQLPPSHWYPKLSPDSAVYDRRGQRLLLFVSAMSFSADTPGIFGLWQLSLQEPPTWSAVLTTGDGPQSRAKVALDADGNRLFAVGDGVWSLSLDAMQAWTHLANLPGEVSYDSDDAAIAVDQARRQLIVSDLASDGRNGAWALSLDTNAWVRLGDSIPNAGAVTVFDEGNRRLVTFGVGTEVEIASLTTDGVQHSAKEVSTQGDSFLTGVIDAKRNRILYFGGRTNAVSSLDLDTFQWAKVAAQTRLNDLSITAPNFIWDPVRSQVVAFGDFKTRLRGPGADDWRLLSVDTIGSELAAPIYDSAEQAVVSFGSYDAIGVLDPLRLASKAGSAWEQLDAGAGPGARSSHVGIYDEIHHRMIIHGGVAEIDGGYVELGDVWALTLDGAPAWVPMELVGPSPHARRGHVGIYDPEGRRMIVYGGSSGHDDSLGLYTDLWSLSLDDAPRWTELAASGTNPGAFGDLGRPSAAYDPAHRRMIVLAFSALGAARVFALELHNALSWHEFCSPGITPSANGDVGSVNAVLASDGLFFSTGGAPFRFNLETPYCDG